MSNLGDLDSAQSREVEEQLFATHRLQANRHVPVPLRVKISGIWFTSS